MLHLHSSQRHDKANVTGWRWFCWLTSWASSSAGDYSTSWENWDRGQLEAPGHETARSLRRQKRMSQQIFIFFFQSTWPSVRLTSPGLWAVYVPAARWRCRRWLEGCSGSRKPETAESERESQTPAIERNKAEQKSINKGEKNKKRKYKHLHASIWVCAGFFIIENNPSPSFEAPLGGDTYPSALLKVNESSLWKRQPVL